MGKKRPPSHLLDRIRHREEAQAFEEHLLSLRRNPPDEMVIRSSDGNVRRFRIPKVRPGPRRIH